MQIALPNADGTSFRYTLTGTPLPSDAPAPFRTRIAYAAAHVVIDPRRTVEIASPVVDWDRTLGFREHLWSIGFGVAEAMDTAQRGMGLDWPSALELIQRSARDAAARGGLLASGAGTDHLDGSGRYTLADIIAAYTMQSAAVEQAGSRIILMASRALARVARSADDYLYVYGEVLRQVREPVILHWLGPMFDPALLGYWGSAEIPPALELCLRMIESNQSKVEGIKISLLNAELEISMRRRLPPTVRMYTGDDFHYDRLIRGDSEGYSHALLGIFDPIAPVAAAALLALDRNDLDRYHALLAPTVPLSRHIFQAPTFHYKTGIVFLAWLNGFQSHFRMIGGSESGRSVPHLATLFQLADAAGLLSDPDLAVARMNSFLKVALG